MKITRKQLRKIIQEETDGLDENVFTSALKTAATRLPGGRAVSDFTQAQAFDDIEDRLVALETAMNTTREEWKQLESQLVMLFNKLGV